MYSFDEENVFRNNLDESFHLSNQLVPILMKKVQNVLDLLLLTI
ncbi:MULTISPECIES: hypothetical protein [unclassified Lysinibacillus]